MEQSVLSWEERGEIIYTNKTKSIITLVVKQRQEQACNFLSNNLIPSVE